MNLEQQLKRSQNNLGQCNDSSSDVSMVTTNMWSTDQGEDALGVHFGAAADAERSAGSC